MSSKQENPHRLSEKEIIYRKNDFIVARFSNLEDISETRQVTYPLRQLAKKHSENFLQFLDEDACVVIVKPPQKVVRPEYPSTNLHGIVITTAPTIDGLESEEPYDWLRKKGSDRTSYIRYSTEKGKESYIKMILSTEYSSDPHYPTFSLEGRIIYHVPEKTQLPSIPQTKIYDLEGNKQSSYSFYLHKEPSNPFFIAVDTYTHDDAFKSNALDPQKGYFHQLFIADFGIPAE